jgi:hypothetical protein
MKIFLSWSGDASHQIAQKLHSWLPMVIQRVEPYISTEIEKGSRWSTDIANELEKCSFGIACVTRENRAAPWLLFEAGALSKSVADGRLAPLLCGINQTDIQKSPLTQFQMTKFEKAEFFRLLKSINESAGEGSLDESVLSGIFTALWPDLEKSVNEILKNEASASSAPTSELEPNQLGVALEEILSNSRALGQLLASPERILPPDYVDFVMRRHARNQKKPELQRAYSRVRHVLDVLQPYQASSPDVDQERLTRAYEIMMEVRYLLRDAINGPPALRLPLSGAAYRERTLERADGANDVVGPLESDPKA